MRRERADRRLAPAVVSVLGFLALMLVGIALAHPEATTPRGVPYKDLPAFRMWSIIGAATMIIWLFVCAALWRIGTAWRYEDRALRRWTPPVLYAALAVLMYFIGRKFLALDLRPSLPPALVTRLQFHFVVGAFAAAPAVLGLWLVHADLRGLRDRLERPGAAPDADAVADLRRWWKDGQRCLSGLAVIISTGLLSAGLLRKAVLAAGYTQTQFPAPWLLVYGAFFTVPPLLVYISLLLTWRDCVTRVMEIVHPLPGTGLPTEEWTADRERLERFLRGSTTLKQNVTAAFGILAPFGGSLLSLVIPDLKTG